jgi:hypothetical protein
MSRGFQLPLRSVLRFSQPLDGFLHLRLHGLVSSRSHVQGFRTGVWSRPAAVPARRRPLPPCTSSPPRSPVARLPCDCACASRPCSAVRCERQGRFLPFLAAAPLFGFPPPGPCDRSCPVARAPLMAFSPVPS